MPSIAVRQASAIVLVALLVFSLPAMTLAGGLGSGTAEASQPSGGTASMSAATASIDNAEIHIGDDAGNVYALDSDLNIIDEYSVSSSSIEQITGANGELYVSDGSAIYRIDDNGVTEMVSSGSNGNGLDYIDGYIYYSSGSEAVKAHLNGSTVWRVSHTSGSIMNFAPDPLDDSIYVASRDGSTNADNQVLELDVSDGSLVNSAEVTSGNPLYNVETRFDGEEIIASHSDGYQKFDIGLTNSTKIDSSGAVYYRSIVPDDTGALYFSTSGSDSDGLRSHTDTDSVDWTYSYSDTPNDLVGDGESLYLAEGSNVRQIGYDGNEKAVDSPSIGGSSITAVGFADTGNQITGVVQDQDQNPIENATVEAWGVAETALDESDARSLERQAQDLIDQNVDPVPDAFDRNLDVEDSYLESGDSNVPLVYDPDGFTESAWVDHADLSEPQVIIPSGETMYFLAWDPSADGDGWLADEYERQLPGSYTDSGPIVIEQIGPEGDVKERMTVEVDESSGGGWGDLSSLAYGKATLPTGIYEISVQGSDASYMVAVGEPSELFSTWESELRSDLEDEADQYLQRAQNVRDMLGNGDLVRKTVQTDANGRFEVSMPSNVVTADVRAMKADGDHLQDIQDPSMQDLREFQAGGYNGTFYLPQPQPNTVEPPADNVSVTVIRSPEVPMGDMSSFADLMAFLENQRLNETIHDLRSEYEQRLEEMERSSLEETYRNHRLLVETALGAEERYLERSAFEEIQAAEDLTNDELSRETRHMQVALANVNRLDPPDVGSDIIEVSDDGLLSAEYPLPDGVDHDTISVELRDSTGNYQPVDDEYWYIESGGIGSSDTVVVEDVPVDDTTAAMYELRVQAAAEEDDGITPGDSLPGSGQDGGLLDDRVSAPNPTYGGSIPELDAVDFSTIAPGPSERVHVDLEPAEDTGYGQLVEAEAWNANGDLVNATIDSDTDRASFKTDGDGVHEVWLTFQNEQGDRFVISERIRAHQQSRPDPATIRTSESILGDHAIVGERLESARIETTGSTLRVDAIARDSVGPSELNVYPGEKLAGTDTIDISVLHGSDEARVNSNVLVNIHVQNHPEDALHWRNGQAFAADGSDNIGHVMRPNDDKAIIQTRTDENGHVSVTVEQDPNWLDRANHRISRLAASVPNLLGMIGSGLFTLVAGFALRRRYYA